MSSTIRLWFRRALVALSTLCLAAVAWLGLAGVFQSLPQAGLLGRTIHSVSQALFGLLSIACVLTSFWYRRLQIASFICWIVVCTFVSGIAPVVWGHTTWQGGLAGGAFAFFVTSLIALFMLEGTRADAQLQPNEELKPTR